MLVISGDRCTCRYRIRIYEAIDQRLGLIHVDADRSAACTGSDAGASTVCRQRAGHLHVILGQKFGIHVIHFCGYWCDGHAAALEPGAGERIVTNLK